MLEPPNLAADQIVAVLERTYAIHASAITFLPVGNDATAWFFRVESVAGEHYALKVKQGPVNAAALFVPRYLHTNGLTAVVPPWPAADGTLTAPCANFTLILYPFIAGETAMATGLTPAQWRDFGALIRQLHTTVLPEQLARQLRRESFVLRWTATIQRLAQQVMTNQSTDPIDLAFILLWREHAATISTIVDRTIALGRQLQAASPNFVLCHADIHTANLLVDAAGDLHIVDWDDLTFAPKERDLMFITGRATIRHPHEHAFVAGYGAITIDPVTFAYYRYEWAVQELADYGSRILLTTALGKETRQTALVECAQLFAPGDVVDVAYGTEVDL